MTNHPPETPRALSTAFGGDAKAQAGEKKSKKKIFF
jgi:hypothetical protein